ncbi:type II toxin-antitoxin system RelE/ParE family toxin [Spectribacter hydrogenoxidans]|uniref:Type II toxin-antitoxin system RelE/ParE family toxin n=1 Tax=Spectribacter hydrogenoxidans TaxID=3075608 RepID=A0ABU3C0V1_9GAMM|nr:type II toxin-antitoxin system RelE/ParE family toxin [Salinisphaera sp. W335]MDT0635188.1 type II toxin-antitoxin system RelE/ParE family toxin [Salinisphaera sp. W335]
MTWSAGLTWSVEFDDRARRELRKLDPPVQRDLLAFLRERIVTAEDPRRFGKPLRHGMQGLWRYRLGSYRLICRIEDSRITVLVLAVGHRKTVYR